MSRSHARSRVDVTQGAGAVMPLNSGVTTTRLLKVPDIQTATTNLVEMNPSAKPPNKTFLISQDFGDMTVIAKSRAQVHSHV